MSDVKRYSYGYVDDGYGMRTLGLIEKPDGNLVLHTDFNALLTENLEQARLLGMSAERELALLAERDALRKDAARLAWLINNRVHVSAVGGDLMRLTREAVDHAMQGKQP